LESIPKEIHTVVADADFEALMVVSGQDDVILEEDDRVYERATRSRASTTRLVSLYLAWLYWQASSLSG